VVTVVALLGGVGLIPGDRQAPAAAQAQLGEGSAAADLPRSVAPRPAPSSGPEVSAKVAGRSRSTAGSAETLPDGSGTGRRIVFDIADQRVWLVDAADKVISTYLVSGSLTHNLQPGSYHVYSRSRWAVGVDDSGVMQYFVRFAHGPNAAIGFHTIPTHNGKPLQTVAQLGTPQSHGCIRQRTPDAIRLWNFAPVGTRVVVTA